nr:hypothetical protein [Tanacetum cinerariifolium]
MEQPNPTFAKIPIFNTGRFEQWKFRIQRYLQNEHYALWEVIEFDDSYQAPSEESGTCSGISEVSRPSANILKYQAQQSKPLSNKEQREFYMSILRSHAGWKTKHFRGMTLEEIREKFIPIWKQIEDFVPMSLTEEAQRMKRKGLKLEQGSAKKMKTSEEVSEEDLKEMMQLVHLEEVYVEALQVKHPIIDWEIHSEGQRDYWKITRLGGHTAVYQFFVDMLK